MAGPVILPKLKAAFFRSVPFCALALLAACSTTPPASGPSTGVYKVGSPYKVNGKTYVPHADPDYDKIGVASWYGDEFNGRKTANGEIFDKARLSAAHTTLPLPSLVEVENLENGRRVVVRVNDRGPFVGDRLIDVSHAAARALGFDKKGLARVRVRYLGRAELSALAPLYKGDQPSVRVASAPSPAPQIAQPAAPAPHFTTAAPGGPAAAPTPPVQTASAAPADSMANLITTALSAPPAPRAAPKAAAATGEFWIDVATYSDLKALEHARLSLVKFGDYRIVTNPTPSGAFNYSLQSGPYPDKASLEASLAALREAGYSDARAVSDLGLCAAEPQQNQIATC
ncbi:MAG: septal ring lytic transglycosylase RlpA family protein [Alphaproteobacteria bacterium]|nr:septal ring lytic transglycosylase RlpA family protein [Alphaproteobacteria bacterium]